MATAKTIEQLDAATQINAGDKLPFAQAAGTEAKSGTVAQLAETVADINETGALAELVYATSQGKNAVAAALTAKGAATTASETLIQMADKINDLDIVNDTTNITGYYYNSSSIPSSVSLGATYTYLFRQPISGDSIFIVGSKIYYIPNGKYGSLEEFTSAATHTYDLSTEDISYTTDRQYEAVCISEDFSKLLIQVNDSYLNYIFTVSSDSGFTKIKELTKQFNTYNDRAIGVGISDAGDFILYQTAATTLTIYSIDSEQETNITMPIGSAYLSKVLIKPQAIYVIESGTGSAVYHYGYEIPYTKSDSEEFSFGTVTQVFYQYVSSSYPGNGDWLHIPGESDVPLLLWRHGSSTLIDATIYAGSYHALGYYTYTKVKVMTSESDIHSMRYQIYKSSNNNRTMSVLCLPGAYTLTYDESNFYIKFPFVVGTYIINRSTGETTAPDEVDSTATWVLATERGPGRVLCFSDTKLVTNSGTSTYDGYLGSTVYELPFSQESDKYIYCKLRKINDQTAYYDTYVSYDQLTSGAYDVETTITPAVPDSADSATNAQADSADNSASGAEAGSTAAGATPQAQDAAADAEGADA